MQRRKRLNCIIMFNGVLLIAIIATWIPKVTSLPKLYNLQSVAKMISFLAETKSSNLSVETNESSPSYLLVPAYRMYINKMFKFKQK